MLSHLKRRFGVLTAVAVLAALVPTLAVSTASAAPATTAVSPATSTTLSACPASASIPSAAFTDTTSTDVDCIAYYGITQGTTATTYEPTANIPRWQMATFLIRTATEAGVTLGDGSDQGFTDISGWSADIQTKINQLKQLGVTNGTTTTTYSPDDNVTREQMAMFLDRLLSNTAVGPNGNSSDTLTLNISGNVVTYNYTDIDAGSVTYEGHNSIAEMYHHGVFGHAKTDTTFGPLTDITRAEMATWLTNALAHTNLRPSGLHIQATHNTGFGSLAGASNELHVSNRDASFDAIADTVVDIFGFTATTTADEIGIAASGACKDALEISTGAEELCLMENTDYVTDQNGNIEVAGNVIAGAVDVAEGESTQYWAWTAALGTYFSSTQTASTTTVTSSAGGDFLNVTSSHPYANSGSQDPVGAGAAATWDAKMGSDVTLTVQLRSTNTGASSTYNVAQEGCYITVAEIEANAAFGTTDVITNSTLLTDANGTATYVVSKADPTALDANDAGRGTLVTFANSALNGAGDNTCTTIGGITYGTTSTSADADGFAFDWDDEVRVATTVTASAATSYTLASATGTGATNTITGTSYDQYGVGIANGSLGMTSYEAGVGAATAATYTVTRTTNSSGAATFGVTRDAATAAASWFTVNDTDSNAAAAVDVYWVVTPSTTALDTTVGAGSAPATLVPLSAWTGAAVADNDVEAAIVRIDVANDVYIVDISYFEVSALNTYVKYTWDADDNFYITGAANTQALWEYYLTAGAFTPANVDDLYHATNNGTQTVLSTSNPSTYKRP